MSPVWHETYDAVLGWGLEHVPGDGPEEELFVLEGEYVTLEISRSGGGYWVSVAFAGEADPTDFVYCRSLGALVEALLRFRKAFGTEEANV